MSDPSSTPPEADGTAPPEPAYVDAPTTFFGILRRLGPGLIIAGSIVGSGELIATTKTGAQAGITLLWLIVLGCLIKVFVQIELGRYSISHGETTLLAFNRVPGPRLKVNWIVWAWLFMMLCTIGQLGGIVGGVGQSLAISAPITGDFVDSNRVPSEKELGRYLLRDDWLLSEWDLRLYREWTEASDEELQDNFPHPYPRPELPSQTAGQSPEEIERLQAAQANWERLRAAQLTWLQRSVARTGKLLEVISDTQDDLRFGFQHLIDLEPEKPKPTTWLSQQSASAREARTALERTLVEANQELLQTIDADRSPIVARLKELTPDQLQRVLRGHQVLAEQLADLDLEDHRGVTTIAAVFDKQQITEKLKPLQEELKALTEKVEASGSQPSPALQDAYDAKLAEVKPIEKELKAASDRVSQLISPWTLDDKIWAGLGTLLTIGFLWSGRYNMLQNVSMVLVVAFTFITIGNVISLQMTEQWHISMSQFIHGLSFDLPETMPGEDNALFTALATFGIIGVGATELITYPYWCLEKGYARFTGPKEDSESWIRRARAWMRVMLCDAFLSMVVYTTATLAFYIMGVAVLFNDGRDPEGMRMVSTLASAYVPVFGAYAGWLFLLGAIAVLYSTFLVANAGNARMYTDGCKVFGLISKDNPKTHERAIRFFSVVIPCLSFSMYFIGLNPVKLVLISGIAQGMMLPMIGIGSLYFRYRLTDDRLKPSRLWDVCLVVSCLGLLLVGGWEVVNRLWLKH